MGILLQNSLDTENRCKRSNWAGSIKECLESYGFQDVWAQGGVSKEAAFLSAIRQKIVQRFKLEWSKKISNSDRFATYLLFRSVHQASKYLNDITIKKFRGTLIRLRLGINELGVNKRFQPENAIKTCPFCPGVLEDESHFLFMLVSDINTWGSLLTMMLNPLLILYLKTQVLMLTGKLQCLLFTLWSTEKKCWLRNPVLVCNCQAMGYRYYASYPAPCTNVMYLMLVIQHSVRMWCILC